MYYNNTLLLDKHFVQPETAYFFYFSYKGRQLQVKITLRILPILLQKVMKT